MKIFFTLTLLLASSLVIAQDRPYDYSELNSKILSLVNNYRDSLNLQPLKNNAILNHAAEDQADYMSWNDTLSHNQITYNKQTPAERVFFYNGNYNYIGENVAYIIPSKKKEGEKPHFISADSVALQFFTSWINSPGHRENIINPLYYQSGISFSYNEKANKLYGTQVFSALGYKFPKALQSPAKAYGVQPKSGTACGNAKNFRSSTITFANNLIVEGDSIFLWHHNLEYFQSIIANPNDGYAIDIVFKEQLPCNSPNLFHGSGIFDGYMLPPVFQYELYKNNRSANPKKLMTFVGVLPPGIKNYELNMILIRDNTECDYSYPVDVPEQDMAPLYIAPLWIDTIADAYPIKIDTTIITPFEFERSSTIWNQNNALSAIASIYPYTNFIKSIKINTYSSVEGKEWFNIRLQEERAAKIATAIRKTLRLSEEEQIKIKSEENWNTFYKQIKTLKLSEFENKDKEQIKRYLKANKGNSLYDSLLYEQRIANSIIKVKGIIKPNATGPEAYLTWVEALKTQNVQWLTKILYLSKDNMNVMSWYYNVPNEPVFYEYTPLAVNLLAKDIAGKARRFDNDLSSTSYLYLPQNSKANVYATTNWINLYFRDLYSKSINYFSTNPAENKPAEDPEKVLKVLNQIDSIWFEDTTLLPRLKLNQLLTGIHYYTYTNKWGKVNSYFDQIFDHFYAANLPLAEGYELALFCNHYYRHAKAVKLLDYYFEKETLDEDACFALSKTATLIYKNLNEERYLAYMELAIEMNKDRWCSWLTRNFQVKRNEKVKGLFCETCL